MTNQNLQFYFFLGLLGLVFALNVALFFPFFKLFAVITMIAVVFHPLYLKIKKSVFTNENLAAILTILIVAIIILVPISFFTVKVFNEAQNLHAHISTANQSASDLSNTLSQKFPGLLPKIDVSAYLKSFLDDLTGSIGSIFSSIFHIVLTFFLSVISLFFFLRDGRKFIKKIIDISPLTTAHDEEILGKLHRAINSILKGALVVALIQGVLTGIGFFIFGVPNPSLWGVISVFAALIPGVGTALVIAPAIIYLFATGTIFNAVGLTLWGLVIVGLVDNFLRPFLVGRDVHIHPFLILLSVFGGLALFGPLGFLLGPLVLSLLFALFEIYPMIIKSKSS